MSQSIRIGVWIEKESRDVSRCPSYYAADYEILRTVPGEYPLFVVFETGYNVPMPYWICTGISSNRIKGELFCGCGGVNYASTKLPLEPTVLHIQNYSYQLRDMIAGGNARIDPKFDWLCDQIPFKSPQAPKTWEEVKSLAF